MAHRKGPKRHTSVTRPARPKRVADPMRFPLDRSHAQKLRTDRTLSFKSLASRAHFWAAKTAQDAEVADEIAAERIDVLSPAWPGSTPIATANIQGADLAIEQPNQQGAGGFDNSGIAPPPPPAH